MFPEGVLASAMALLSQFFAASAAVSGFFSAGSGDSLVFCAGFEVLDFDAPAEGKNKNYSQHVQPYSGYFCIVYTCGLYWQWFTANINVSSEPN